jgi:hypothetical protein
MADSNVTITKYSREAIRQMEAAFQAAGGSSGRQPSSSSNPNAGDPMDALGDAATNATGPLGLLAKSVSGLKGAFTSLAELAGSRGVGLMLGEFRSGLIGGVEALDGGLDSFENTGEMMSSYIGRFWDTFGKLGITIKELHEFNTKSRAASINLGGLESWTAKLTEGQEHYFARLGGNSEAVEHQTEMMNLLTQTGGNAEDLYGTFGKRLDATNDDLLKMGVTYKESREHLVGMTKDENIRQRLMSAAGKKERQQILLEVQARFKHLKSLGMTTEQAESASKALAALSGKGPLDRIKEAAKMQAGMSALGIENAEEVARIYKKGDRATPEEREIMRAALGQLQEVQAASRTDLLGRELSVAMISTSTGLDKMEKVFSELLGKTGAAVTQQQLDDMKIVGIHTENANKIVRAVDNLNTVMSESWIPEIPAMAGDVMDLGKNLLLAAPLIAGIGVAADLMTGEPGMDASWNILSSAFPKGSLIFSEGVGRFGDWVTVLTSSGSDAKAAKKRQLARANAEEKREERKAAIQKQIDLEAAIVKLAETQIANHADFKQAQATTNAQLLNASKTQIMATERQIEKLDQQLEYQRNIVENSKPETKFQPVSQ